MLTSCSSQQAGSYVTKINQDCFEKSGQCYSVYGFEYAPGFDEGYIQWIADNKTSWHITGAAMQPDPVAGIGRRPIPQEPLYLILNLGQSPSFTPNISPDITYPVTMYVDYIRVYQPKGQTNVGCDPKDFPTAKYIAQYVLLFSSERVDADAAPQEHRGVHEPEPDAVRRVVDGRLRLQQDVPEEQLPRPVLIGSPPARRACTRTCTPISLLLHR
jgi:hypothetical protein